jgi:hypothetical protein
MDSETHVPWPGWTSRKTLVLPIPADRWTPPRAPVTIDAITFMPKRELHVTLNSRGLGQVLHGAPGERGQRAAVRAAFEALDWEIHRTGERLRLEKRELSGGRAIGAIIERIEMPAMTEFYEALAQLLGRTLAIPPPHVTLYTTPRSQGLALPDAATLRRLTVREVAASELSASASGRVSADASRPHARH